MRIDICIATFRRPAWLERLLQELTVQQLPDGVSHRIIVVDNDPLESARGVVEAAGVSFPAIVYLTQTAQNISLTRNRAIDHSDGDLIAFIDDDESAPPEWLSLLLATMERHAADVVIGPVGGILPDDAPRWVAKGGFFDPPKRPTGTAVRVGGTGNALVKATAVRGRIAFDPRYGLSGSEDTDFFYRLWQSGARMIWCQEALVIEHVPPERLTVHWLLQRGFGAGQGYADAVGRPVGGGPRRWRWILERTFALAASCFLTLCCIPFGRALTVRYAMMSATHLGRLSTVFGYRQKRYRAAVS